MRYQISNSKKKVQTVILSFLLGISVLLCVANPEAQRQEQGFSLGTAAVISLSLGTSFCMLLQSRKNM